MEVVLDRPYKFNSSTENSILYVDDEVVNLRIFKQSFKRDYTVFTALNANEAIEILRNKHIDLIITDQQMPGMRGSELLIKIVPQYPNIVRMIMTGFSDINAVTDVVNKVGLDKYLVKPWNKDELKKEFDKCLSKRKSELEKQNSELGSESEHETSDGSEDLSTVGKNGNGLEEFIKSGINLKEALLPRSEELKIYLNDGFILHDHFKFNKHGYWFGESKNKFILASFHCNTDIVHSITLNAYVVTCLIELIYIEGIIKPDLILSALSARIQHRFFSLIDENIEASVDISIVVYDQNDHILEYCGANQNLYYYNQSGEFVVVEGAPVPLSPNVKAISNTTLVMTKNMETAYIISNAELTSENTEVEGQTAAAKASSVLKDIYTQPMNIQKKKLAEYKFRFLIGMRLD